MCPHRTTRFRVACAIVVVATTVAGRAAAPDDEPTIPAASPIVLPEPDAPAPTPASRDLASVRPAERAILDALLAADTWPHRAIGVMRLERYGCAESAALLAGFLQDPAWQVRVYAIRSLGRRRVPAAPDWFLNEDDPRVVRAAMRHRYAVDPERVARGVRYLSRTRNLTDAMLAIELAVGTGREEDREVALELFERIINRMGRGEAGRLGPRLAQVADAPPLRERLDWQRWYQGHRRENPLGPGYLVPDGAAPLPPGRIAALTGRQFAALSTYLGDLASRDIDLALCIDTTASMGGELAEAQGGIDDLMIFANDVARSLRFGVVAYRDQKDEYETLAWDLTGDIAEARSHLWGLDAAGGGDRPESVYPALQLAFKKMSWRAGSTQVVVVVGDAPPRVGTVSHCEALAQRGAELNMTTHTIEAKGRPVPGFDVIAAAGGGECVSLGAQRSLVLEITGLTLGRRFDAELGEFFEAYLALCR